MIHNDDGGAFVSRGISDEQYITHLHYMCRRYFDIQHRGMILVLIYNPLCLFSFVLSFVVLTSVHNLFIHSFLRSGDEEASYDLRGSI